MMSTWIDSETERVDLYWLPLGAGGHSVRWNGRVFEAVAAARAGRRRCALYHSALVVTTPTERFSIELAPALKAEGYQRGVTANGPVGVRWAGRFRCFRYEIRCWRDGIIPDIDEAVQSPRLVSAGAGIAQRVLDLVPHVPTLTWGRDEAGTGEMWNSNSVVSWLLERADLKASAIGPPNAGRAPGWMAGVVVANRQSNELPQVRSGNSPNLIASTVVSPNQ